MRLDREKRSRRSIRLEGYDYSHPGVFFLTLCAYEREELFGEIVDGELQMSPLGRIVRAEWFRSAEMRKEIQLFKSEFGLMPNHLHGIVWINGSAGEESNRRQRPPRELGTFLKGFKDSVIRRARDELKIAQVWQRNDHEHIVRNENELQDIRVYIQTNPLRWQEDQLHPSAGPNRFNQEG